MSLRRPISRKPIPLPKVHAVATQPMFGDGPISVLISARVFAGRTQLKYAQILAVHVAYDDVNEVFSLNTLP